MLLLLLGFCCWCEQWDDKTNPRLQNLRVSPPRYRRAPGWKVGLASTPSSGLVRSLAAPSSFKIKERKPRTAAHRDQPEVGAAAREKGLGINKSPNRWAAGGQSFWKPCSMPDPAAHGWGGQFEVLAKEVSKIKSCVALQPLREGRAKLSCANRS